MSYNGCIPIVDLSSWSSTATPRDPTDITSEQKQCSEKMLDAMSSVGAFIMRNSNLSAIKVEETMAFLERFIHLPMDQKLKYKRADGTLFGYFQPGAVRVCQDRDADLNEAFIFQPQFMRDKNWPENELPGIRQLVSTFMSECYDQALKLVWILGMTLNVTNNTLTSRGHSHAGGQTMLRLNYYAPVPEKVEGNHIRMGEHTDYDTLTLLMGNQLKGLQAQAKNGEWVDVTSQPGDILVNAGELLERWSAGVIRACYHRVILPEGKDKFNSRVTLPYFLAPDDKFVIANITNDPKFPPVETSAYVTSKFNRDHKAQY